MTSLESWTSYVYMEDLKGVKEIDMKPVCKELKEKLTDALTVRSKGLHKNDI